MQGSIFKLALYEPSSLTDTSTVKMAAAEHQKSCFSADNPKKLVMRYVKHYHSLLEYNDISELSVQASS